MIPRLVIAAPTSGAGKTSVSVAFMKTLRDRGYKVQGFKIGPDYIDPSYHSFITGRQSRNLDVWLMGENGVLETFYKASADADVAVIEGVMGLFDGLSGKNNFASTAHVAKLLKSPVVLVLDAGRVARSIAAVVLGFLKFDRSIKIAGVILNNVAGEKHARYCTDAIREVKIPVLGIIKRNKDIRLEERHLGLIPIAESNEASQRMVTIANSMREQMNVDRMISIARKAPNLQIKISENKKANRTKIAVALDESFNFYYADNLDMLRSLGAELEFFSPVKDSKIPETDGLILGGGFPEVLADRLERNTSMLQSVRNAITDGMPTYAECGGLMYLTRSIREADGRKHNMVHILDADTVMGRKLILNYTEAKVVKPCVISKIGRKIRGHEFHYSGIDNLPDDAKFAYALERGNGVTQQMDGFIEYSTLASYMHTHFANRKLAENFVQTCMGYSRH